jgi:ATPase subunit of ABC transporter with duplicated ATPase domains
MRQPPLTRPRYPGRQGSCTRILSFVRTSLRGAVLTLIPTNSTQEQEIIEHGSSCYVIGRSGTGKTTTMLFKMLGIQRIWETYPEMGPKPRQIFITQSRVLALKVEEYFEKLMSSLKAAACSAEELRTRQRDIEQDNDLMDQDDNQQWRSDLPERFSELSQEHFPLFITYDRVWISSYSAYSISPSCE